MKIKALKILGAVLTTILLLTLLSSLPISARAQGCEKDGCSGEYENGICTQCDGYQSAPQSNGFYEVGNEGQFRWVAMRNDATISLIDDIELSAALDIGAVTLTLDLNGHTVGCYDDKTISAENASILCITDSLENGGIINNNDGDMGGYALYARNATVTIEGGRFEAKSYAVYFDESTVNILGGSFLSGVCAIENHYTDLTLSAGSVSGGGIDFNNHGEGSKITLTGGSFPDGLSVFNTTLNEMLGDGNAFWESLDGKSTMLTVADGATEIASEGDITVKKTCLHENLEDIEYLASENCIEAICKSCNNRLGEASITAESKSYDGTSASVSIQKSGIFAESELEVLFFKGETQLDASPSNAGTYVARITLGDASAEVEFTIAKLNSTYTPPKAREDLVYNKGAQELISVGEVEIGGEMQYSLDGESFGTKIPTATDAGEYTVYYKVLGNESYNGSEVFSLTVKIEKAKGPSLSVPKASPITYGDRLDSSILTGAVTEYGSFTWEDGSILPSAGENEYSVIFTPSESASQNYEILKAKVSIPVTVAKKTVTVTAEDKAVCVGDAYELTYNADGFIGSEGFISAPILSVENIEDSDQTAGEYEISINDAQVSENYEIVYVGATLTIREHLWDEGKTTQEPTCTEKGVKTFCCSYNENHERTEDIEVLKHTEIKDEGKKPTCTEDGLTVGKHCTVCGTATLEQETIPMLGHAEEIDALKAPTCTEDGLTEGKHCTVCGTVTEEQKVLSALDHAWEDASYDAPKTCVRCNITEGNKLIPPETEAIESTKPETDKKNDEDEESSGCFAALPLSAVAIVGIFGTAITCKKRKNK